MHSRSNTSHVHYPQATGSKWTTPGINTLNNAPVKRICQSYLPHASQLTSLSPVNTWNFSHNGLQIKNHTDYYQRVQLHHIYMALSAKFIALKKIIFFAFLWINDSFMIVDHCLNRLYTFLLFTKTSSDHVPCVNVRVLQKGKKKEELLLVPVLRTNYLWFNHTLILMSSSRKFFGGITTEVFRGIT